MGKERGENMEWERELKEGREELKMERRPPIFQPRITPVSNVDALCL